MVKKTRKAKYGPHRYQFELGKRSYSATATVADWVRETKRNINVVIRGSIQDVIDEAQTPTAKGGKMRIDTGFLRASGQMSLTGMPTGPIRGEKKEKNYYDKGGPIVIADIAKVKTGVTVFFGWTAAYAIYREAYDGFLFSAIQNWQKIVDNNVAKLRTRLNNKDQAK